MGGIFSKPKAPPPLPAPPAPAIAPDLSGAGADAARLAASKRRGRASQIVGGKKGGLLGETDTTETINLLGG